MNARPPDGMGMGPANFHYGTFQIRKQRPNYLGIIRRPGLPGRSLTGNIIVSGYRFYGFPLPSSGLPVVLIRISCAKNLLK